MRNTPNPQGKYIPVSRSGNIIFTSGMTPRENGVLLYTGKVSAHSPVEEYRDAVRLATSNALTAIQNSFSINEIISKIVNITVYIAVEEGFTNHSKVADFASEFLFETLGESGIGCRAAVGVYSLPKNAIVEIVLAAEFLQTK